MIQLQNLNRHESGWGHYDLADLLGRLYSWEIGMRSKVVITLFVALCFSQSTAAFQRGTRASADVSAEQVRNAIFKGGQFLIERRKADGRWPEFQGFRLGTTALCTLALLNSGVEADNLRKSLDKLQAASAEDLTTYVLSLRIMALAAADPEGRRYRVSIQRDVQQLVRLQTLEKEDAGGWSYARDAGAKITADASNSQFAILALHEASLLGIEVDKRVWQAAKGYWTKLHRRGSGFRYDVLANVPNSGSMTCAGISSWIVINENLATADDFLNNGSVACCGNDQDLQVVRDAINWMGKNFTVRYNPIGANQRTSGAKMYYLYGMERAGRLSGERFFGDHDWYREGAAQLIEQQKTNGAWKGNRHGESLEEISTAFALLFLSKGRRPVVFGKYQHTQDNDWDRHPKGIHYLTRQIEDDWNLKLNWQTVRGADATVDDLLEAPVLFISGRDEFKLTEKQENTLKKYVENGGFIFAEACQGDGCGDNVAFDKSFRALVGRLFPESKLEVLPPDHAIWTSSYQIKSPDPDWPLLGVQACCRTSIVYCPRNLAGYWRLNRARLLTKFPVRVQRQINYCTQIGVNVAAYATGREVVEKGERPKLAEVKNFEVLNDRALQFAKLQHDGGADDAPNAWRNLQTEVGRLGLRIKMDKKLIAPIKEQLADHPFVFMHGRNDFRFSREERKAIKRYLELGGCIFADSICSSPEFTKAFRREFNQMLEGQELEVIPNDHPIYNDEDRYGYKLSNGVILRTPDPNAKNGVRERMTNLRLESLKVDGRFAVIFSPYDLSCALENATANQCEGYSREDAIKIGTTIILYRLRVD